MKSSTAVSDSKREEEERLGVKYPGAGYADPDYAWSRSFVADDVSAGEAFLAVRLFAIGSHLAELIVDLKHPTEDRALIDRLSRDFGNLREVFQTQDVELAAALIEPVLDRFRDTLDVVAQPARTCKPSAPTSNSDSFGSWNHRRTDKGKDR